MSNPQLYLGPSGLKVDSAGFLTTDASNYAAAPSIALIPKSFLVSTISSETSRAVSVEVVLSSAVSSEISRTTSAASSLTTRVSDAQVSLAQYTSVEIVRAVSVEGSLESRVSSADSSLTTRVSSAEVSLTNYTSDEIVRAVSVDTSLHTRVSDAQVSLAKYTSDEIVRAVSVDASLHTRVSDAQVSLTTRVSSAEISLTKYTSDEISRAMSAETSLATKIAWVVSNTDPSSLDSLTEIVNAYQSSDQTMNGALRALITDEVTRATSSETSIVNRVVSVDTSLHTRVSDAQVSLAKYTSDEIVRAVSVEGSLESRVSSADSSLTTRVSSAEISLTKYTSNEIVRAVSVEGSLESRVSSADSSLTTRVSSAETSLTKYTSDEIVRAIASETSLANTISTVVSNERSFAREAENMLTTHINGLFAYFYGGVSLTTGTTSYINGLIADLKTPVGSIQNSSGSPKYLTGPTNSALIFDAEVSGVSPPQLFTIEFYIKCGNQTGQAFMFAPNAAWGTDNHYAIQISNPSIADQTNVISVFKKGSLLMKGTVTIANNVWRHVAIVRAGSGSNNVKLYVDGNLDVSATDSSKWDFGTNGFIVGSSVNGVTYYSYKGYFSNLRVLKGVAAYIENFTPPSKRLTNVSGTMLLLQTATGSPFVDSSSSPITLTQSTDPLVFASSESPMAVTLI